MRTWFILLFISFNANAMTLDETLSVAIDAFQLEGNLCEKQPLPKPSFLTQVGKIIFERPVLSGDKDTACANCHLDNK
nr:methylamine utilization protein MauG [Vibrio anguillarum]